MDRAGDRDLVPWNALPQYLHWDEDHPELEIVVPKRVDRGSLSIKLYFAH
jgi:hypothetical protein